MLVSELLDFQWKDAHGVDWDTCSLHVVSGPLCPLPCLISVGLFLETFRILHTQSRLSHGLKDTTSCPKEGPPLRIEALTYSSHQRRPFHLWPILDQGQIVSTSCKIQNCLQAPDLTLFSVWRLFGGQLTGLSQTFTTTTNGLWETSPRL